MTAPDVILLIAAGLGAGFVNGVAGGGSLLSFPALMALGHPALVANITSTVGIWPGYLGGAAGYRRALDGQRERLLRLLPVTVGGAVVGVVLLLTTAESAFEAVAPWLILAGSALFAVQPSLTRRLTPHARATVLPAGAMQVGVFAASAYGSYFGAGLGVVLMAVLALGVADQLHRINALRSVVAVVVNSIALVLFAASAPVAWTDAAFLAVTSVIGGFVGAAAAQKVPTRVLRTAIVIFGVVVAGALLLG